MAKTLVGWLAISREPSLILAQYRELKRQVPLLYSSSSTPLPSPTRISPMRRSG
ncbi:hypothetical protein [Sphingomonas beigongshangi]|uniref:hypothetical protein n=1 Tax=Sphingomonas beigongshangi TaxID=2782540 RepID=UPI00193BA1A2|nr:hypothetical protein [Sphingomonas beigongshangi]